MKISQSLLGLSTLILLTLSISCSDDESFSFEDQFASDQARITEYLEDKDIQTQADTVLNLRYRVLEQGNDNVPKSNERINISYTIRALNETAIAISDTSKTFGFRNILAGMSVLMPYVEENGAIEMYLPSGYAFGGQTLTKLAANSPVIVTVRLNKIIRNDSAQLAYDNILIDQHIEKNNLDAKLDTASGLRYVVLEQGTGFSPAGNSLMVVNYEGRVMDGDVFDEGKNSRFNLGGLISGWKILMPKVQEGGKIVMFIPSKYGYGNEGTSGIPPYAILKFEVELLELPQ